MRRSLLILLPFAAVLSSCGAAWSGQQTYVDGIYAQYVRKPAQVNILTENDFVAMAAKRIAESKDSAENASAALSGNSGQTVVNVITVDPWWTFSSSFFIGWPVWHWSHHWYWDSWFYPWYDPWFGPWYSPWYDPWYGPWCNPWYSPWHSSWYGPWYSPWYDPWWPGYGYYHNVSYGPRRYGMPGSNVGRGGAATRGGISNGLGGRGGRGGIGGGASGGYSVPTRGMNAGGRGSYSSRPAATQYNSEGTSSSVYIGGGSRGSTKSSVGSYSGSTRPGSRYNGGTNATKSYDNGYTGGSSRPTGRYNSSEHSSYNGGSRSSYNSGSSRPSHSGGSFGGGSYGGGRPGGGGHSGGSGGGRGGRR